MAHSLVYKDTARNVGIGRLGVDTTNIRPGETKAGVSLWIQGQPGPNTEFQASQVYTDLSESKKQKF